MRLEPRVEPANEGNIAWETLRESATMRVASRMYPSWNIKRPAARAVGTDYLAETDRAYYQRRATQERIAFRKAYGTAARKAHLCLARLYRALAGPTVLR